MFVILVHGPPSGTFAWSLPREALLHHLWGTSLGIVHSKTQRIFVAFARNLAVVAVTVPWAISLETFHLGKFAWELKERSLGNCRSASSASYFVLGLRGVTFDVGVFG